MMNQTQLLTQFYQEYQAWVKGGVQAHPVFRKSSALCGNAERFAANCAWKLRLDWDEENTLIETLIAELRGQFDDAKLSTLYPFGELSYDNQLERQSFHTCSRRMAWVSNHADVDWDIG